VGAKDDQVIAVEKILDEEIVLGQHLEQRIGRRSGGASSGQGPTARELVFRRPQVSLDLANDAVELESGATDPGFLHTLHLLEQSRETAAQLLPAGRRLVVTTIRPPRELVEQPARP